MTFSNLFQSCGSLKLSLRKYMVMFKLVIVFSHVAIWIQKAEADPTIFLKGCETSLRGGDKNFTASYNSHKN